MTNTDFYLSLETAKQLKEWGCEWCNLKSEFVWYEKEMHEITELKKHRNNHFFDGVGNEISPAYHILEDICVRYADLFFSGDNKSIVSMIFNMIKNNEKKAAEKFIIDNTIFNPKNK